MSAQLHYLQREQRTDHATRNAHNALRTELIDALMHDPARLVSTPGFHDPQMAAMNVVLDHFSGIKADNLLHETLRIIGRVACGSLDREALRELQLRASALIAAQAQAHATWHRDDMVRKTEEEA